jgi:Polyketide cyclase / dehydrase and lipid transport
MTTLSVSVDIDAPAERTWDVVTDWKRQGEWMPMTNVRVSADTAVGVGAKISARSGKGAASFVDPMVIEVWEPPHRCEVLHLGKVVTGRGVFIVDALPGNRSRFTWQEVLDSDGARKVMDLVGLPPTRMLLNIALRRLARIVASEADVSAT